MEGSEMPVPDVLYRDVVGELVESHPILFRGRRPRSRSEICPGWYALVDQLCSDIEVILLAENVELDVFEIKAKLGGLRFYHGDDNTDGEKVAGLVRAAHEKSCATCMDCGGAAEFSKISVERRRCESCRLERLGPSG